MGLRLVSAIIGKRAAWRRLGDVLLLLGVLMQTGLALAEDQSAGFSATVKVDATADSAAGPVNSVASMGSAGRSCR